MRVLGTYEVASTKQPFSTRVGPRQEERLLSVEYLSLRSVVGGGILFSNDYEIAFDKSSSSSPT